MDGAISPQIVHDYGPIYAETDMSRFPVEPANTASNLIFLVMLIWLVMKMKREQVHSRFLQVVVAVLFVGWVGGTLYHATRNSFAWLVLDYVPILLLGMIASLRLIFSLPPIVKSRFALIALPVLGLGWILSQQLVHGPSRISVSYAWLAMLLLLPALLHCYAQRWVGARELAMATVGFSAALAFRIYDANLVGNTPSLGTHFLWHLLGGVASGFLMNYLYRLERQSQTP